jgi:general secretion pathway protein L
LLEVVVALSIAALALVTLFQTGSGGLFAADTAARIDEAIERAQSHLAAFGRSGAVAPGQSTGDDGGGYRWQMRATPIARQPAAEPIDTGKALNERQQAGPRLVLYEVEVTISWALAAERHLDEVLTFEMDRETPFSAEEVFWSQRIARRDRRTGQLWVRLLLVPRAKLIQLLGALDQAGVRPQRAEIAAGPDRDSYLPLDGHGGSGHVSAHRALLWPALACCIVLALAATIVPFVRQSAALAGIEGEIAADRSAAAEAQKLRQEIDQLSNNADLVGIERSKGGRPLAILASLTRQLPGDTYLTDFVQQQGKVTLTGRSAAASRLIAILANGERLRNPTFAAPVTRIAANQLEIFTITAEVVP